MFSSREPKKRSGIPYWDFIRLEMGKSFVGWLAGPVVGVEVHYHEGSRACRADLTDGAMRCAFCEEGIESRWVGYVPIWDESGVRCVAIIGERYRELALRIPLHAPVRVSKLVRQGKPVKVQEVDWTSGKPPVTGASLEPQDLRPWLLRLWGDADLTAWISEHARPEERKPAEVLTPKAPRKKVPAALKPGGLGSAFPNLLAKALEGAEGKPAEEPAEGAAEETPKMRRAVAKALRKPAGKNGTHKPAKGGDR